MDSRSFWAYPSRRVQFSEGGGGLILFLICTFGEVPVENTLVGFTSIRLKRVEIGHGGSLQKCAADAVLRVMGTKPAASAARSSAPDGASPGKRASAASARVRAPRTARGAPYVCETSAGAGNWCTKIIERRDCAATASVRRGSPDVSRASPSSTGASSRAGTRGRRGKPDRPAPSAARRMGA